MNIESDSYLSLSKFIERIEISIILLLDEWFSDSLNRDNIIFYFFNFSKIIIYSDSLMRMNVISSILLLAEFHILYWLNSLLYPINLIWRVLESDLVRRLGSVSISIL
jgi:hypothetical protein